MDAVIGLGANLGSREATLRAAIALLGLEVVATSRLYATAPLGPPQPTFLNAAVRVRTELAPLALLARMQGVETQLGRVRRERWGPRTVDLDLLWWEGGPVDEPNLTVPHPGLLERSFALAPLLDVAPALPFGGRLAELGPPAPRSWTVVEQRGGQVRARAADDADALALALGAALGDGQDLVEARPIEATSPGELVRIAAAEAASRAARVTIERLDEHRIVGRLILDPPRDRAVSTPILLELGGGACTIALDRGPKLL